MTANKYCNYSEWFNIYGVNDTVRVDIEAKFDT